MQACFFHDKTLPKQSKAMLTFLQHLTEESVVDIRGLLQPAEVFACMQSDPTLPHHPNPPHHLSHPIHPAPPASLHSTPP